MRLKRTNNPTRIGIASLRWFLRTTLVGGLCLPAMLLWSLASVAGVMVSAHVDPARTHLNSSVTYTLRAVGGVSGEPDIAPLKRHFDVLRQSSNFQIQTINGIVKRVDEWRYELMPRDTGHTTIPPIAIDGVYSNAVTLDVLPAIVSRKAAADLFLEVQADRKSAYVQSQIIYTVRMFVGVRTTQATVTPPKFTGGEAVIQKLGKDRQYRTTRAGRQYTVFMRRYVVFPQQPGRLTIGPTVFEATVITDLGFSRIRRLHSKTINIDVKSAVPPPSGFSKVTWLPAQSVKLTEAWSADPTSMSVGVPLTRTVTITARGLLDTQLPAIDLSGVDGVQIYPDQPDLSQTAGPDGVTATRSVHYVVMAQTAGHFVLPPLKLSWFDTTTGKWNVARLPAHRISVAQGTGSPTMSASPPVSAPAPAHRSSVRAADGRTVTLTGSSQSRAPLKQPWAIAALLFAIAWLGTAVLLWRRYRPRSSTLKTRSGKAVSVERRDGRRSMRILNDACTRNDSVAARDALLAWAAVQLPKTPPRTLGALATRSPPELATLVRELEAHLYGRSTGPWKGAQLAKCLGRLKGRLAPRQGVGADGLAPLYR